MRRAALLAAALAAGLPAAASAAPRYAFTAETTVTTVVVSTCTAREGGSAVTESMTWEIRSTQSGTSAIGRGSRAPDGHTKLTGTIRRETVRQIDGQPWGEPQGGTHPLQEDRDAFGVLYRAGKRRLELRLSHGGLLDPRFAPLAAGASTTIVQDPPAEVREQDVQTTDGGTCRDEERTDVVRTVTVTRLR